MHKIKNIKSAGFTIIEVLIVLAIAGLIMIVVFLAVPTLQSSQRDSRRRNDLAKFYAAVKEYQSFTSSTNAPFVYVSTDTAKFEDFKNNHLGPEFADYDIEFYDLGSSHSFSIEPDKIIYFPHHFCPEDDSEQVSGPGNHPPYAYAILMGMERNVSYVCLDQGNKDY